MGCRFNRLDESVFMAVPKPILTEFGIYYRLESCDSSQAGDLCLHDARIQDSLIRRNIYCTYLEHHIHPWEYPDDVPGWERDMEKEPDLACQALFVSSLKSQNRDENVKYNA